MLFLFAHVRQQIDFLQSTFSTCYNIFRWFQTRTEMTNKRPKIVPILTIPIIELPSKKNQTITGWHQACDRARGRIGVPSPAVECDSGRAGGPTPSALLAD